MVPPQGKSWLLAAAGARYVTFDGIARACAQAMGAPEPELIHFNPKNFDFGKKKAFPMRDQHFFASIDKAQAELGWTPQFGLVDGLRDSYEKVRARHAAIFWIHCCYIYCPAVFPTKRSRSCLHRPPVMPTT
jgi:nucleoside-diphosphate-sugar epimerase